MKTKKDKVQTKKQKAKAKIAAKKSKMKTAAKIAAFALMLAGLCSGCARAQPASRATSADYKVCVEVEIADNAGNRSTINIPVTFGDGAFQAADSSGSTETQTATPTLDVKPDIDVRYNDAIAGATAASKSVLGSIGEGIESVLSLMQSKKSGTVTVKKKDGTEATVECKDGQCSYCEPCGES